MATRPIPVIRALYSDGDTVIALFDAEGVALDDRPYRNSYAWFMQFRGDRIVKVTAFTTASRSTMCGGGSRRHSDRRVRPSRDWRAAA
ncbi:hypothetical protein A9W95_06485 [Mycobacterium sp. 1423905.2]|nr:hypothetical protein A9W95_06485 [Mycobacterium sp. 1423905.2]